MKRSFENSSCLLLFSKKALTSLETPLYWCSYFSFNILQNEEARLRMFLKPFKPSFLKLKRGKQEEISQKIFWLYHHTRSIASRNSKDLSFRLFYNIFLKISCWNWKNYLMKIQGFKKATSEMNRPHCVLHTDRLYIVHHSFPITSSSILVRYMMTTKVSY